MNANNDNREKTGKPGTDYLKSNQWFLFPPLPKNSSKPVTFGIIFLINK